MAYGVFGVCFILFFRVFPLCELTVKIFKFRLTQFLGHIRIDVQGRGNIRMSQRILNHLDVHARFAHPGREGMPQSMAAETRQEYGAVRILRQHFIVAVPDDASDGFVQRSLMLALSKAIDEDEVRVTVHRYRAADSVLRRSVPYGGWFQTGVPFSAPAEHCPKGCSADSSHPPPCPTPDAEPCVRCQS